MRRKIDRVTIVQVTLVLIIWTCAGVALYSVHDAMAHELPDPPRPAGYYQMEQGEVFALRCPTNPDNVQPAVNVALMDGEWRVIVGCPEVINGKADDLGRVQSSR